MTGPIELLLRPLGGSASLSALGVLLLALSVVLARYLSSTSQRHEKATIPPKKMEDLTPGRNPGEWIPQRMSYPPIEPWLGDLGHKKPIPYRPFRWGDTYPINMGVRPMDWQDWMQVDQELPKYHRLRLQRCRLQAETSSVLSYATVSPEYPLIPSSSPMSKPLIPAPISISLSTKNTLRPTPRECALEVLTEMTNFLAQKYPAVYRVAHEDGTGHFGSSWNRPIKTVENLTTGEMWDLEKEDPIKVAGLLSQDDLAILQEREDGQAYLVSASICLAGHWRLLDKISLPLDEIHFRGNVPGYASKLQFSMNRFFLKLKTDKPVERNNWFLQVGDELAWSDIMNGNEADFDQATHAPRVGTQESATFKGPRMAEKPEDVYLRTERQTLRRMPKTGCILFTIRTYFLPVIDMAQEPGVPGRLANAIRSWPEAVARHKYLHLFGHVLLPWLDQEHQRQLSEGIITQESAEKSHKYPF